MITKRFGLRIVTFAVLLSLLVGLGFIGNRYRKGFAEDLPAAAASPAPAALHVTYDPAGTLDSGVAATGYFLTKSDIDNDFTLRLSLKGEEFDDHIGSNNVISIEGNNSSDLCGGNNHRRLYFIRDSSPNANIRMNRDTCNTNISTSDAPTATNINTVGEKISGSTKPQVIYEDYFLVYKKPVASPPQDGYFRIYRSYTDGTSILPLLVTATSTTVSDYRIPADHNFDWTGSDTGFRLVIGDPTNKVSSNHHGEGFKVTEVTMWSNALDSDTNMSSSETYTGKYYGGYDVHTYTKYHSPTLDAVTYKPYQSLTAEQKTGVLSHYGGVDDGYGEGAGGKNLWKNDASTAGNAQTHFVLNDMASLSSDVPIWPGVTYPTPSNTMATVTDGFSTGSITDSGLTISSIEPGTAQGNAAGSPLKRVVYVGRTSLLPNYSPIKTYTFADSSTQSVTVTGLPDPGTDYYVTVKWIDRLENATVVSKKITTTGSAPTHSAPSTSLRIQGKTVARQELPQALPVNSPLTFRTIFKLNAAPTHYAVDSLMTNIFGIYDSLHISTNDGYPAFALKAGLKNGKIVLIPWIGDGEKEVRMNSGYDANTYEFKNAQNQDPSEMQVGVWQEFWVSYQPPTVGADGSVSIYRYVRNGEGGGSLVDVYTNDHAFPKVKSWYEDYSFKKWLPFIYFGLNNSPDVQDFEVNQTAWWTEPLNRTQVEALAGRDLNTVTVTRRDSSLYWHVDPVVSGSTVVPTLGNSRGALDLTLHCLTYSGGVNSEAPCASTSNVPSFVGSPEIIQPSTLDLTVQLRGRVGPGQTLANADHSHSAISLELRSSTDAALNPPVSCTASSTSAGLVALAADDPECGTLVSTLDDNPGTQYHLTVRPGGHLPQKVTVTSANLNTTAVTFTSAFQPGVFSNDSSKTTVALADFAALASYYNGNDPSLGISQAYGARPRNSLLSEFAILANLYNNP